MTSPATAIDATERQLREQVLKWILIVSWIDLLLFLPLLYGVIADVDSLSPIFGPIHGVGFVIEVGLIGWGAINKWWGWWYPIVTVITTGPPGAILGHRRAKREAHGEVPLYRLSSLPVLRAIIGADK